MHIIWSLVSLSTALVYAQDFVLDKTPLRFNRRILPFSNTTLSGLNTTTTVATSTSTTTSTTTSSINGDPPSSTVSTTSIIPSALENSSAGFSASSTPGIYANSSTETPTCTGSVTYFGSVPPTVYLTVTEGFNVTVTASNASVTESPTLITPLPACQATIVPLAGTENPALTASAPAFTPAQTVQLTQTGKNPQVVTVLPPEATSPQEPTETAGTVYSSVDYTSTVIVTKKTPVTVVAPPTTSAGVNFQIPSQAPTTENGSSGGGSDGSNNDSSPSSGNGNGNSPAVPANENATPTSNAGGGSFPSVNIVPGQTADTLVAAPPTTTGLGNIIASIINSPFATAPATARLPTTTTINNVPVTILSSSVVIGGQTVAIPTSSQTTVEADGQTFTVRPSEIIAPTGTITISPVQQGVTTPRPVSTTVTAGNGLTFTVGSTVAIIAGTTYRIGSGAPATTITVDGTKISIGPSGVGLPSTTVAPEAVTGSPFVVYTADGLTFSVDGSEAVVSGTTYRIGSNAPEVTTTIGTETISFGPGGVGLRSTTIVPTTAPSQTAEKVSKSTSATSASATQSLQNAASLRSRIPFSELLGWYLTAVPLFCLLL